MAAAARAIKYDARVIRQLVTSDLAALVEHLRRSSLESGTGGDIIFRPRSVSEPVDARAIKERHLTTWGRRVGEPLWARTWGVFDGDDLVGHADLHGGALRSELHRATVGIGIERRARRQGWGRALMETLIAFGRAQGLAWIDLGVFANNAPARALYRSLGFVELGLTRDRFRVDGQSIDDVVMTLALG